MRLRKAERLSGKRLIQELFDKGSSFYLHPLKVIFLPGGNRNQVLVTVSKALYKRAVDRNLIKRRIREGYRINKGKFSSDHFFSIAYIYTAREILPSAVIHQKIVLSFQKISNHK